MKKLGNLEKQGCRAWIRAFFAFGWLDMVNAFAIYRRMKAFSGWRYHYRFGPINAVITDGWWKLDSYPIFARLQTIIHLGSHCKDLNWYCQKENAFIPWIYCFHMRSPWRLDSLCILVDLWYNLPKYRHDDVFNYEFGIADSANTAGFFTSK